MISEHRDAKAIRLVCTLIAISWGALFILMLSIVCGVAGCSDSSETVLLGALFFIAVLVVATTMWRKIISSENWSKA